MKGICKILGILLFIRALISAPTGCEPNCTLQEAYDLCREQLGVQNECMQQCQWEKGGHLDENGYLVKEGLNQTDKDPDLAKLFTHINWICWEEIYGNGTSNLCEAATEFYGCVNYLGVITLGKDRENWYE